MLVFLVVGTAMPSPLGSRIGMILFVYYNMFNAYYNVFITYIICLLYYNV